MGKYHYIIYQTYPKSIIHSGTIWAFSEKHAHRRLRKIVKDNFYVIYK